MLATPEPQRVKSTPTWPRRAPGTRPKGAYVAGIHYGPVVDDDASMASETAKITHWAASNAKAEQTLGTSAVIDALLGRGTANDMIVRSDLASRQHLSVQFSRGRRTTTDNSTNGTVIFVDPDGDVIKLKRDSHTLVGAGRTVLGQPDEIDDTDFISYKSV